MVLRCQTGGPRIQFWLDRVHVIVVQSRHLVPEKNVLKHRFLWPCVSTWCAVDGEVCVVEVDQDAARPRLPLGPTRPRAIVSPPRADRGFSWCEAAVRIGAIQSAAS